MRAKILTVLLLIAVTLRLLIPATGLAAGEVFTTGGIKYKVLTDPSGSASGTAEVIANSYTGNSYTIPASVSNQGKKYDVTRIGDSAFKDHTSLQTIVIPNSVTRIGDYVFEGCTSLEKITIPNSVTSIGDSAFMNCRSLKRISLPLTVTSIGRLAFKRCSALTNIGIPGVRSIGLRAFEDCTALTSIFIPDFATSIGTRAFSNCSSLKSANIPVDLTNIELYTFLNCSSLTALAIPKGVRSIGGDAFKGASILRVTLDAGSQLTNIGRGAYLLSADLYGANSTVTTYNAASVNDTVDILIAENRYRFNPNLPAGSELTGLCMQDATQPLTEPPKGISSDFTWESGYYTFTAPPDPVTIYSVAGARSGTAPEITTQSLPDGHVGTGYSANIAASGTKPITYSVAYADSLPDGLTLTSTGVISGTPTQAGSFSFIIRAANSVSYAQREFTINIKPPVSATPTTNAVTVTGGTGSGSYKEGAIVTITADAPAEGKKFKAWTISPSVTFVENTSAATATAKFTMPAEAVTATATYEDISTQPDPLKIVLNQLALKKGGSLKLPMPEGYSGSWTSGDDSIATVDSEGNVKAVGYGRVPLYFGVGAKPKTVLVGDQITIELHVVKDSEAVKKVSVSPGSPVVAPGERLALTASVSPATAKYKRIVWTSADEKIATVDENGVVEGVASGKVKITATSTSGKAKTVTVTVTGDVTKIALNPAKQTIGAGDKLQLSAIFTPVDAPDKAITWTSGNSDVASVDLNGLVTGINPGKATITAVSANGIKAKCAITVKKSVVPVQTYPLQVHGGGGSGDYAAYEEVIIEADAPAPGMVFDRWEVLSGAVKLTDPTARKLTIIMPANAASLSATYKKAELKKIAIAPGKRVMAIGDKYNLAILVEPLSAELPGGITWTSDAPAIATVNVSGLVEAISEGTATITAQSGSLTSECVITVIRPEDAEKLTLTVDKLAIAKGKRFKLNNLAGFKGAWSIDDSDIASISGKGVLKAKSTGEATLTFSVGVAQKGAKFMGKAIVAGDEISIKLFVVAKGKAVTKLTVKPKSLSLTPGESATVAAAIKPKKAAHPEVFWRSGDPKIAAVDAQGNITAISKGKTRITATTTSGITKAITVAVK